MRLELDLSPATAQALSNLAKDNGTNLPKLAAVILDAYAAGQASPAIPLPHVSPRERQILRVVSAQPKITRAEIMRLVPGSANTTHNVLARLTEIGGLTREPVFGNNGGRPSFGYVLGPKAAALLKAATEVERPQAAPEPTHNTADLLARAMLPEYKLAKPPTLAEQFPEDPDEPLDDDHDHELTEAEATELAARLLGDMDPSESASEVFRKVNENTADPYDVGAALAAELQDEGEE